MRNKLLGFLKRHPRCLAFCWGCARLGLRFLALFARVKPKTVLFSAFGGRSFDDSPRAIYEGMLADPRFADFEFVWAFTEPDKFSLPRGRKVKIDTPAFFRALLTSRVWVGNSDIDRGIGLKSKKHIRVETWHGTPFKKIGGEENENSMMAKPAKPNAKRDKDTIRCAQSDYDREILARVFAADENAFLMCDLPRNDELLRYSSADRDAIKEKLGIPAGRRVILYMPTYREYLLNEKKENYLAPPITQEKWRAALGEDTVVLVRAHYAVAAAMDFVQDGTFYDVSAHPCLSELYAIADVLLSDYSSAYVDFSILGRPMLCFAYDRAEYEQKRGLYIDLGATLPCPIAENEDELLSIIHEMDTAAYEERTRAFCRRFAPHAGHATEAVLEEIEKRLHL
ncbi:MAG: CDP-glycerol glycerophosphotransferase family protein [Clostridia bacterium]|nr:CDP-glycerol glycerophosphotransferase family protein [Clostridia bacterium]